MSEPTTTIAATTVTASGLTVFGVATGLDPGLLFAGLAGALLAIVFQEPMSPWKRIGVTALSAVMSAWLAKAVALGVTGMTWWPRTVPAEVIQHPAAAFAGLLMYLVIAPKLIQIAQRKADGV